MRRGKKEMWRTNNAGEMELDDEEHEKGWGRQKKWDRKSKVRESWKENKQLLKMADESTINATSITEQRKTTFLKPMPTEKKENMVNQLPTTISIQPPNGSRDMKEATGLSWAMFYET